MARNCSYCSYYAIFLECMTSMTHDSQWLVRTSFAIASSPSCCYWRPRCVLISEKEYQVKITLMCSLPRIFWLERLYAAGSLMTAMASMILINFRISSTIVRRDVNVYSPRSHEMTVRITLASVIHPAYDDECVTVNVLVKHFFYRPTDRIVHRHKLWQVTPFRCCCDCRKFLELVHPLCGHCVSKRQARMGPLSPPCSQDDR